MKKKIQVISPLKILAFIVLIYLVFGTLFFRLHIANVLPLFFSVFIMFLQSRVNRYAFLIGALNSILYAVAYFYMTLYSSAAYALLKLLGYTEDDVRSRKLGELKAKLSLPTTKILL